MDRRLPWLLSIFVSFNSASAIAEEPAPSAVPQDSAVSNEQLPDDDSAEWEEEEVEELEDLKMLPEYKKLLRNSGRLKMPPSIDPDSNYAKLFEGGGSRSTIFKALGGEIEGFDASSTFTKRKHNHILATRVFHAPDNVRITLFVILPHPAFVQMANEGIEFDLPEYELQSGVVAFKDKIMVNDRPADLIHLKDGSVRAYVRLPKRITLILSTNRAKDARALSRLLESLSIGELERHIRS